MKKIINVLLCMLVLFGCANREVPNSISSYEDKGITFSLPKNYYLDEDNGTIIHYENGKLEIVGNIEFKDFNNYDEFNSFFKLFTVEYKKEYIKDLDAYKGVDIIRSNTYEKYAFYNKERFNYFNIIFINQNEKLINSVIETINNKAELKNIDKKVNNYSFDDEWKEFEFDSFKIALPSNVYISNPIDNQFVLFVKNNDDFKRIATLYLDEFSENEFDYYKDVSPSGSRIKITDNIYKDVGIYSLINYDKKTISSIWFNIDINNDFEKKFVDSLEFAK